MEKNYPYNLLIETLKTNRPELENKNDMVDNILEKLPKEDHREPLQVNFFKSLFAWTEIQWIRNSLTTAAVLLLTLFVSQQVILLKRIESVEKSIVKTNEIIRNNQPDLGTMQKVMLNMVLNKGNHSDSIKISASDLEALLKSYKQLYDDYEELIDNENSLKQNLFQQLKSKKES